MQREHPSHPTRRAILGAALVGGALIVGYDVAGAVDAPGGAPAPAAASGFGPFIRIARDGTVTVVSKHVEFGQGAPLGLAVIVAEELDADWNKVVIEQAPADMTKYGNNFLKLQVTAGSTSISNSWMQYRQAGAAGRDLLVRAAAAKWGVQPADIAVRDGIVSHAASGRKAGFGELIEAASKLTPAQNLPLKDPKNFTLIGTDRARRYDTIAKTTGAAIYTLDVQEKGLLTAMVAHAPKFGAKVQSFDAADAKKIPGVVDVVQIPSGVAVLAKNTYAARKGRDALKVLWDDSQAEKRSTDQIVADFRKIADGETPAEFVPYFTKGDPKGAFDGKDVLHFRYDLPYLAHATMEPMNCVARVDGAKVHLTYGAQAQGPDSFAVAGIVGCKPQDVRIDALYAGGSFGRRANFAPDYVAESVFIAKHVGGGTPVKLVWTREDDMAGGRYRPLSAHAISVKLGPDGYPVAWRHRLVIQSISAGTPMGNGPFDPFAVEGLTPDGTKSGHSTPYLAAIPVVDSQVFHPKSPVTVSTWRSVPASFAAFVMEHTIDRLAQHAGKDPVEYRRELYRRADAKRHLAVLDLAAEKAGWGKPIEKGWARGVAVHHSFFSVVANVAEVGLVDGAPRVRRAVTAADCGLVVVPDQVRAQMEGGLHFGLSAALRDGIVMKDGVVQNTNFDGYQLIRMADSPELETHLVPSAAPPAGAGEPGTPVIIPATCNALLTLTKKPTASLPLIKT